MDDFDFDKRFRECLALAEERLAEYRAMGDPAPELAESIASFRRQLNKGGRGSDECF